MPYAFLAKIYTVYKNEKRYIFLLIFKGIQSDDTTVTVSTGHENRIPHEEL